MGACGPISGPLAERTDNLGPLLKPPLTSANAPALRVQDVQSPLERTTFADRSITSRDGPSLRTALSGAAGAPARTLGEPSAVCQDVHQEQALVQPDVCQDMSQEQEQGRRSEAGPRRRPDPGAGTCSAGRPPGAARAASRRSGARSGRPGAASEANRSPNT